MIDNPDLDDQGFAPFAILKDIDAGLDAFLACHEESRGVDQTDAKQGGSAHFAKYPNLSYWKSMEVLKK